MKILKKLMVEDLRDFNGDEQNAFRVLKATNIITYVIGDLISIRRLRSEIIKGVTVDIVAKK